MAQVTFPLTSHLMNRRHIPATYAELLRVEQATPEEAARTQFQRLRQTLTYAAQWVPWYQRRFKEIGLEPGDIKSLDDLKRIPPLTRADVIDHHREMVDSRQQEAIDAALQSRRDAGNPIPLARFRRHRLVRNNSSGSTGAPTVFFEDGSISALNWALEQRHKHWFGVEPGSREARMVRLSTSYVANSLGNRWRRLLWHQLILPGMNLRDADYELCRRQIEDYQPCALWGITGSLTGLADYLQRSGRPLSFRPAVVAGWAAPVYDHEQALLEAVFRCPISNIYSAREVGHIALKCPHENFHINQEHLIVETQPAEDSTRGAGSGEVLVTTLVPTPMPFIRYRMGDIARIVPSRCPCGRTLPVLEEFAGRTGEIFTTRDGRMISPNFWGRIFMARDIPGAVKRFQVIYTRDQKIVVKIVRGESFNAGTAEHLSRAMHDNFAPTTAVLFKYVDEIKPTVSGKYLMVQKEE